MAKCHNEIAENVKCIDILFFYKKCDKTFIIMNSCHAAEMLWLKTCSLDITEHICLVQTPTNKCHISMILIVESDDAIVIIPATHESYRIIWEKSKPALKLLNLVAIFIQLVITFQLTLVIFHLNSKYMRRQIKYWSAPISTELYSYILWLLVL